MTNLTEVLQKALGWNWEDAPGVPSAADALSDVVDAVESYMAKQSTTEWGVRSDSHVFIRLSLEAAQGHGLPVVMREVTEWRPVSGESK